MNTQIEKYDVIVIGNYFLACHFSQNLIDSKIRVLTILDNYVDYSDNIIPSDIHGKNIICHKFVDLLQVYTTQFTINQKVIECKYENNIWKVRTNKDLFEAKCIVYVYYKKSVQFVNQAILYENRFVKYFIQRFSFFIPLWFIARKLYFLMFLYRKNSSEITFPFVMKTNEKTFTFFTIQLDSNHTICNYEIKSQFIISKLKNKFI